MRYFTLMVGSLLVSSTVLALDAPHIGSGASLTADIGGTSQSVGGKSYAGVVNALGDVSGKSVVKQNLAHIGDATVQANAKISLKVKNAGVVNALGAFEGAAVVNQSIASVSSGSVGSNLNLSTTIANSGVVNVVGAIGGDAKICQSIGSIGDNCKDKPLGE